MARRYRRDLEDGVPRIPRGKGWTFSMAEIVRIATVATALVAVVVLQQPCADSMSQFVTSFDQPDARVRVIKDAGAPIGTLLRSDMTPEEIRAAIEKERAAAVERSRHDVDAGPGQLHLGPP